MATVTVSFDIIVSSYNNNLWRPVSQESERYKDISIYTPTRTHAFTHINTHSSKLAAFVADVSGPMTSSHSTFRFLFAVCVIMIMTCLAV